MASVKIKKAFSYFKVGETYEVSDKLAARYIESGRADSAELNSPVAPPEEETDSVDLSPPLDQEEETTIDKE